MDLLPSLVADHEYILKACQIFVVATRSGKQPDGCEHADDFSDIQRSLNSPGEKFFCGVSAVLYMGKITNRHADVAGIGVSRAGWTWCFGDRLMARGMHELIG